MGVLVMLGTALFDGSYVSAIIDSDHLRVTLRQASSFLATPRKVAARAEVYARRLRRWQPGNVTSVDLVAATYAGCCIYAISRYGYSFTSLARLSTKAVAEIVVSVSGDPRLDVEPQRQAQLVAIGRVSELAQLVVVAELMSVAQKLARTATPEWLPGSSGFGGTNYYELQTWADHSHNMLQRMRDNLFARQQFANTRTLLDKLLRELAARTRVRKIPRKSRAAFIEQRHAYASLVVTPMPVTVGIEQSDSTLVEGDPI